MGWTKSSAVGGARAGWERNEVQCRVVDVCVCVCGTFARYQETWQVFGVSFVLNVLCKDIGIMHGKVLSGDFFQDPLLTRGLFGPH